MTLLKEEEELVCLDVQMYYFYCSCTVGPWYRRSELDKCWLSIVFLEIRWCRREQVGRSAGGAFLEVGCVEVSEPCWPLLLLPRQRNSQEEPSKFLKVSLALKTPLWSWLVLVSLPTPQMRRLADVI